MSPRNTIGYVRLEWTCPNCNSRNPGSVKTCQNCGAPQPENVQFERAAEEKLVTDQKEIQAAAAGADIYCAFCGTRNPAGAKVCSQCGADLTEGKARESGARWKPPNPSPPSSAPIAAQRIPPPRPCATKCGSPLPRASAEAVPAAPMSFGVPMGSSAPAAPAAASQARKPNWLLIGGIGAALPCLLHRGAVHFCLPLLFCEGNGRGRPLADFRASSGSTARSVIARRRAALRATRMMSPATPSRTRSASRRPLTRATATGRSWRSATMRARTTAPTQ